MAKRRGNDEGTVYYSEADGCWFAQLPPDTKGRRPKRRAKTQREALNKLRTMQEIRRQGGNPSASRMRLNELLDLWLKEIVAPSVKPSTHESYEEIARLYIRPHLGTRWVDDLDPLDIQQWVNILGKKYRLTVVRNAKARLHAALEAAITWRKITHNPSDRVKLPRQPKPKSKAPPVTAMLMWLQHTENHRLGTLYYMAAILGLRIGELTGLCWRHYNRTVGTLTIEQQIHAVRGTLTTDTPKSGRSRVMPVTPELARRLAQQWELLQRERTGTAWREHGLIFPTEVGTPFHASNINRHLREGLKALDLPHWSMHAFRHFMSTRMAELGVPEQTRGELLGHATEHDVTKLYTGQDITVLREAVLQLETFLRKRAA